MLGVVIIIAVPVCLVGGCILLDQIPLSAARPPENLKTIEDFRAWKGGAAMGKGVYESSGVTYTVMLAPAGRYLPSGPSAYLFDQKGQFIDWTADMGDYYTVKNHFNLTSGNVKQIEIKTP
jgi:hypothetical protein